ncbi:SDR family NAD(P)-dependent oxidoreductase [Legionella longbeachae]|uniref:SDR family NAD(P)-dependent oxidoreductase n=1 Tax=Legionella longbeachae TaxID=450 RepID=UPI0001BEBB0D|nr:SDR family NAD(P)-dependent oxidoreductase [Legionella longbeachae]ARM34828.1 SDR family NAD(P)-dependent oxidoreductase [Legionella longbeachae]EEZ95729.1 short chain dehydrogenase/reductase family oxidoreductase [Legionella longbeachae D-4968]QIN31603.1 SDR family NAD(P)-dependent oxidoreductase [Legionella longbeachae]HBD7396434.1 SDR family NAD(P)-dependent oxidoreductase [Legionella pneumophila]
MFVITGGGSGIGKFLAFSLAKRDQSVLIVGRREKLLQETAATSAKIQYMCADVSTSEGLESIRNYLLEVPRIDALINNAGTLNPLVPLREVELEDWQHTLNTNLNAALFLTQKLYNKLINGRVLNIGSGAAYFPIRGWAAYCVSKAALSMLTQCWQLESEDIAFASVMPGIIDTHMQVVARSSANPDYERIHFYQRLKDKNCLISPETVAEFLTWLLLDIDKNTYASKEWDIYDTEHHPAWLKPPHQVLHWDF